MPRAYVFLGRPAGVAFQLHVSWFLFLPLTVAAIALEPLAAADPDWSPWTRWLLALATAGLVVFSLAVHEIGHLTAATLYNVTVREIVLYPFGGVMQPGYTPFPATGVARTAVAGPLASFLLGGFWLGFWWLLEVVIFLWLAQFNVLLGALHLAPAAPLDGARVLWLAPKRFARLLKGAATSFLAATAVSLILLLAGGVILASGLLHSNLSGIFSGALLAMAGLLIQELPAWNTSVCSPAQRKWLRRTRVGDLLARSDAMLEAPRFSGAGAGAGPIRFSADTSAPPEHEAVRSRPTLEKWVIRPDASLWDALWQMDAIAAPHPLDAPHPPDAPRLPDGPRLLVVVGKSVVATVTGRQIYESLWSQPGTIAAAGEDALLFLAPKKEGDDPWN